MIRQRGNQKTLSLRQDESDTINESVCEWHETVALEIVQAGRMADLVLQKGQGPISHLCIKDFPARPTQKSSNEMGGHSN